MHVPLAERFLDPSLVNDTVDQIVELAAIDSGTSDPTGVADAQACFRAYVDDLGSTDLSHPLRYMPLVGEEAIAVGPLLHLRVHPDAERRVIVVGHMDTVYGPGVAAPQLRRDKDRLQGPGVADMKGGLVMLAQVMRRLEQSTARSQANSYWQKTCFDVLVVPDEEIGSPASSSIVAEYAAGCAVGLSLEPPLPDGTWSRARPGSANMAYTFVGQSAHAGRALREGRNAIVGAAEFVAAVDDVEANVATIVGGAGFNLVADRCTVTFNKRAADTTHLEAVLAQLDETACAIAARRGLEVERRGGMHRPPKPWSDEQASFATSVREQLALQGHHVGFTDTLGVCDGNNLAAAGVVNLDTAGIEGGAIHSVDEFAAIGNLGEQMHRLAVVLESCAAWAHEEK